MTATPAALRVAAQLGPGPSAVPKAPLFYGLETTDIDATGPAPREVWHAMYVVTDASVLEDAGRVSATYQPWREEPVVIEARVVGPDGRVSVLDPTTLIDGAVGIADGVYSDRHVVRGPLPGMVVGAIVELVVRRQLRPERLMPFESTSVRLGGWSPARFSRLTLRRRRGQAMPSHVSGLLAADKVQRTEARAGKTLTTSWVLEDWRGLLEEDFEVSMPPDLRLSPLVEVSLTKSWQEVAVAYADVVEAQLKGFDGKDLLTTWGISQKGERDEVLQQILTGIAKRVRYTGLEIGEASMRPRSPAETLERGYSDCKDLATLAVGLMRGAGIGADVALIRAEVDDIQKAVPGTSPFNHAIVVVGGKQMRFIDVTDSDARPDDIRPSLQGHHALVAHRSTRGLVQLPRWDAAQNVYREVRTFTLTSGGPAKIQEETTATGIFRLRLGDNARHMSTTERQAGLQEYVDDAFLATGPTTVAESFGDKIGEPYRLSLNVVGGRGQTDADMAAVYPLHSVLLSWFPNGLTSSAKAEPGKPEPGPRRYPAETGHPMTTELIFNINVPPGFEMPSLPADEDRLWGPARLERRWRVDGSTLVATNRITLSRTRLTPTEVTAFQEAAAGFVEGADVLLRFPHRGARLVSAGILKDGISAFRTNLDANPNDAFEHLRFALALKRVGLGDASHREGRRAATLFAGAPVDENNEAMLASVFASDVFGAHLGTSADIPRAIYHLEQSLMATEPDDEALIERQRLQAALFRAKAAATPGGDSRAAPQVLKHLAAIRPAQRTDQDRGQLLLAALEVHGVVGALPWVSEAPNFASYRRLLTLIKRDGVVKGKAAFIAAVPSVAEHEDALTKAASMAVVARDYDLARALLPATITTGALANIRILQRCEDIPPASNPEAVAKRTLMIVARGGLAAIEALDGTEQLIAAGIGERSRENLRDFEKGLRVSSKGVSSNLACDSVAALEMSTDGSAADGYRVPLTLPGVMPMTFFLVPSPKGLRVLGFGNALMPEIGAHAFARAQAGDFGAARRWLGWIQEAYPAQTSWEPLARYAELALMAGAPGDDEILAVAALASLGDEASRPKAIAAVERYLKNHRVPPETATLMRRDLADAWAHEGDSVRATALTNELRKAAPKSSYLRSKSLLRALENRDGQALEVIARELLEEAPKDPNHRGWLAKAFSLQHRWSDARAAWIAAGEVAEKGTPPHRRALNERAWQGFFDGTPLSTVLAEATEAGGLYPDRAVLHTKATAHALSGATTPALTTLQASLAKQEGLSATDWMVVGLVAEDLGMLRYALTTYETLRPATDATAKVKPTDSWNLVKPRLERLKAQGIRPLTLPLAVVP